MIVRMPDPAVNLDAIEKDLTEVEQAMERLEAGTYFTDELTGAPLDSAVLEAKPTARHP
jgi:RNA polymerase-binding transcription factor DksA